jgi:hypothetical protein
LAQANRLLDRARPMLSVRASQPLRLPLPLMPLPLAPLMRLAPLARTML